MHVNMLPNIPHSSDIITNVDKKPCILCKMGCGQEVSFEIRNFSDGYSYVIYRDFDDDNFHDCPKIPHHELNWTNNSSKIILELQKKGMDIENEVNDSEFKKLFWMHDEFHTIESSILLSESENIESEKQELQRQLESAKVMCNILPIPFFRLFQNEETNTTYLLTTLAEKYRGIGDYENASNALTIQNEITGDQTDRIMELQKIIDKKINVPELDPAEIGKKKLKFAHAKELLQKQKEFEKEEKIKKEPNEIKQHSSIEVPTVNVVREKIRKVERMLKSFILKSFNDDINQFKDKFPEICEDAERKREISKKDVLDVPEGNIMDYITLGTIIMIITKHSKYFPEWNYHYNPSLHNIRQFRNNYDHYTGENMEEFFSNENKILVNIFSDKLLRYLFQMTNQ